MKRPPPEVVEQLAYATKHYPLLFKWLEEWRQTELEALPSALTNTALAQGRCLVLGELVKLAKEAPELTAKPKAAVSAYR